MASKMSFMLRSTLRIGNRAIENAVWSYEHPLSGMERIKGLLAFHCDKVDHWFEEDEEVFGHARDPYHRADARPSSREGGVCRRDGRIVESPGGISPPGAPRTVHDPLESHGSRCSTVA